MSAKQDRQGVRTAAGLEQKYGFGKHFSEQKKENTRQDEAMNQQSMTLHQFISFASSAIDTLQKEMTTANQTIQQLSKKNAELEAKDTALEESDSSLQDQIAKYWETIYPVGHIYLSLSETSPATLFGGTWERIRDRFLLTAGSTYSAGSTGGEAKHTLTVAEMPSHCHVTSFSVVPPNYTGGNVAGPEWSLTGIDWGKPSTDYTGGSQPHNNMPPYLTVYAWQRTA